MKQKISVSAKVSDFDEAKELIEDLEVLNQKYNVSFSIGNELEADEQDNDDGYIGTVFGSDGEGYRWG